LKKTQFVTPAPKHERMIQLSKVKLNILKHTDKSCNLKNIKTSSRPNQETVPIIFPLNPQTITIPLYVVIRREGG